MSLNPEPTLDKDGRSKNMVDWEKQKGESVSINKVIENNFTYHAPSENQVDRYTLLREKGKELAYAIEERVKDSREKSLALTKLEEAIFWANAGIARNG